jgi:glycosyltransferase involved in cell wall biosynthesis
MSNDMFRGYLIKKLFNNKIIHYGNPFTITNGNDNNCIVTLHDDYFFDDVRNIVYTFKNAKYKIALSNWTKSRYELMGFENIEVIHLGSLDVFRKLDNDYLLNDKFANDILKIKGNNKLVLTIGLGSYKNNELVCKAVKQLGYVHIHIGNDILNYKYENFHNFSHLDNEQLNIIYNLTDVYVRPTKQEGFGLPSVELGMVGIPVVLSDIETNHEIMKDSAIYIKKYMDIESIKKGIEEGLSDNQTIKKFDKKYYSHKAFIERMLKYISNI